MSRNVLSTDFAHEIVPSYLRALQYLNSMYDVLLLGEPSFRTRTHLLYLHDRLMCSIVQLIHDVNIGLIDVEPVSLLRTLRAVNGRDLWLMLTDASSKTENLIREVRAMLNILTNLVAPPPRDD
ncbi:MAG: hypothetical protein K9W43_06700 [Candidatus Thorarchaeota archaeon]|nr:hypothetical protein [Candidatus Thorarchaeota archaeon]